MVDSSLSHGTVKSMAATIKNVDCENGTYFL